MMSPGRASTSLAIMGGITGFLMLGILSAGTVAAAWVGFGIGVGVGGGVGWLGVFETHELDTYSTLLFGAFLCGFVAVNMPQLLPAGPLPDAVDRMVRAVLQGIAYLGIGSAVVLHSVVPALLLVSLWRRILWGPVVALLVVLAVLTIAYALRQPPIIVTGQTQLHAVLTYVVANSALIVVHMIAPRTYGNSE